MADDLEVERLRAELESHRQRELTELRTALAAARAEAERNAEQANINARAARLIEQNYREAVADLKSKIRALTHGTNARDKSKP